MSAELAFQAALLARLVATDDVTGLVPSGNILDRHERPAPTPSIVLGESQSIDEGNSIQRRLVRVYMDLHLWTLETSTAGSKAIAGAIRGAVNAGRLPDMDGYHFADCRVRQARFLRDPEGEKTHGIVTVDAIVAEIEDAP